MTKPERHISSLGIFVHGILTGLHLLGLAHNIKRKNWFDVSCHGGAAIYDFYAVRKHMRELDS